MQEPNSQAIDVMEDDQITQLLGAVRDGNVTAAEELFAITCAELRKIAKSAMRTQPANHTLQPTALVNEAVVRILKGESLQRTDNRRMFYALAARAMRSVLVDYARRRAAIKRAAGSTTQHEFFEEVVGRFEEEMQVDVLALDEALKTLQTRSKRQHDVVVMRFFGGFRVEEIADHLGVSSSTVEKDWAFSKAWLRKVLS